MDKIAQERGLLNKLREHSNITGKLLESINPKFQKMMTDLRATDEKIRSYAEQSKELIKSAKSLVNRRDYLSAASTMSAFHERCRYIAAELDRFVKNIDMDSYDLLLNQFDDEQKERIFGYDPNKELNLNEVSFAKDMEIYASLEKKAGISDWWHNLTNERAGAMKALEKRFSMSFLKDLKNDSISMFNESQRFLQFLLTSFKKLATALARRKPSSYIDVAKSFTSKFTKYHEVFVNFYKKNITPLKQQHEKMLADKKQAEEQAKEQEKQPWVSMLNPQPSNLGNEIAPEKPPIDLTNPQPSQKTKQDALNRLDELNKLKDNEEPYGNIQDKNKKLPLIQSNFISKLEKIAKSNNAKSLMLEILKFSEELESTDPEASLKLLAIAEGIIKDANEQKYYELGKKMGREDLEKYGFGSDIIAGIRAMIEPIPKNEECYMAYAKGYADGCKMKDSHRDSEFDRVKAYIAKHSEDTNNASIFDPLVKNFKDYVNPAKNKEEPKKEENKTVPLI
jgi:hypothetical protein